jgi:hypothetical protein
MVASRPCAEIAPFVFDRNVELKRVLVKETVTRFFSLV